MSKKIKVKNNIHGALGFYRNPSPESFQVLMKQGLFTSLTDEEIDYISINQDIIQKGSLYIDDKDTRVRLGLETDKGEKTNQNILQYEEIVELVKGNYKALEKAINEVEERNILLQFVEVARELNIDSKSKIKTIEDKVKVKIFDDED